MCFFYIISWILNHKIFFLFRGSSQLTGGTRQTTAATAPVQETLRRRSIMWVELAFRSADTCYSGITRGWNHVTCPSALLPSERCSVCLSLSLKAFGFRPWRNPYYLTSRWLRYNVGCNSWALTWASCIDSSVYLWWAKGVTLDPSRSIWTLSSFQPSCLFCHDQTTSQILYMSTLSSEPCREFKSCPAVIARSMERTNHT